MSNLGIQALTNTPNYLFRFSRMAGDFACSNQVRYFWNSVKDSLEGIPSREHQGTSPDRKFSSELPLKRDMNMLVPRRVRILEEKSTTNLWGMTPWYQVALYCLQHDVAPVVALTLGLQCNMAWFLPEFTSPQWSCLGLLRMFGAFHSGFLLQEILRIQHVQLKLCFSGCTLP